MMDEEDEVPELERITVLLLPEASAALMQGAAAMGVSRTDFINMALIKTADLATVGMPFKMRWIPWVRFRIWLVAK